MYVCVTQTFKHIWHSHKKQNRSLGVRHLRHKDLSYRLSVYLTFKPTKQPMSYDTSHTNISHRIVYITHCSSIDMTQSCRLITQNSVHVSQLRACIVQICITQMCKIRFQTNIKHTHQTTQYFNLSDTKSKINYTPSIADSGKSIVQNPIP